MISKYQDQVHALYLDGCALIFTLVGHLEGCNMPLKSLK